MSSVHHDVRVRFAPSPTGYLHVGGARTALYNYLFAKHHGGTFVLRVDDTDEARSTEESLKIQIQDLQWLGLEWDEGVDGSTLEDNGDNGPYRQSRRKEIYQKHAQELIDRGLAYYCFLTDGETGKLREQSKEKNKGEAGSFHIESPYREQPLEKALVKIKNGEKPTVRFKVPKDRKEIVLNDLVRGKVTFPADMVGDFVILRSGGMPVYNFCCAIDDALMNISHVFRAEEHLNNTPRQMMIYEAFDYRLPQFGHISIILGADKQKLSKRHGATSCHEYSERGFLPEALNNFIALLGWSSSSEEEILSIEQMTKEFSTDRLNPSAAVFDEVKLKWMNGVHLRSLDDDDLWQRIEPILLDAGIELNTDTVFRGRALEAFKTKMEVLNDCVELFRPLSDRSFKISDESQEILAWEKTKPLLEFWKSYLQSFTSDYISGEDFSKVFDKIKEKVGVKGKQLFMPIRVAIIGQPHGADLQKLVPLLHKKSMLDRVEICLSKLA